jgi:hypothetical protein
VALDVDDIRQLIIDSVGDVYPTTGDAPTDPDDGVIATNFDAWWELFASKDTVGPGLRMAYTRREAIRRVLAVGAQKWFDVADNLSGLSIRAGQVYKHYQDMLADTGDQIKAIEGSLTKGGAPTSAKMPNTLGPAPADRIGEYIDCYDVAYRARLG